MALAHQLIVALYALQWHWLAMALSLAFVLLAIARHGLCWLFAALSTLVYLSLDWSARSPLSLGLDAVYLLLVCCGWLHWSRPGLTPPRRVVVRRIGLAAHVYLLGAIIVLTLLLAAWWDLYHLVDQPLAEAFILWTSVLSLALLAYRAVDSWFYWLVADGASVLLYLQRGQDATASWHGLYMLLAVVGFYLWARSLDSAAPSTSQLEQASA